MSRRGMYKKHPEGRSRDEARKEIREQHKKTRFSQHYGEKMEEASMAEVMEYLTESDYSSLTTFFSEIYDEPDLAEAFKRWIVKNRETLNQPRDEDRNTLLMHASFANNHDIVVYLLQNRADPNLKNVHGEIALQLNFDPEAFWDEEDKIKTAICLLETIGAENIEAVVKDCRDTILTAEAPEFLEQFYKQNLAAKYMELTGKSIPSLQSEVDPDLDAAFAQFAGMGGGPLQLRGAAERLSPISESKEHE